MNEMDRKYHESYKPSWGPEATLLYAMPSKVNLLPMKSTQTDAIMNDVKGTFVSEGRDVHFAKFAVTTQVRTPVLPSRSTTKNIC